MPFEQQRARPCSFSSSNFVVGRQLIFTVQVGLDGKIDCLKARLMPKGCIEIFGQDTFLAKDGFLFTSMVFCLHKLKRVMNFFYVLLLQAQTVYIGKEITIVISNNDN
jgi:hypothetical protein